VFPGPDWRVRRQRNLSVTAALSSHVLGDETEFDYANLLV
jgi:hypothetical protein